MGSGGCYNKDDVMNMLLGIVWGVLVVICLRTLGVEGVVFTLWQYWVLLVLPIVLFAYLGGKLCE